MTFTPDSLGYQTYYLVTISTGAEDAWGNALEDPISFSFTTVDAPGTGGGTLIIFAVAIFAVAGAAGWLVLRKLK
jgi:hypothetical protein